MPKILQDSLHLKDILISLPVNGIHFLARMRKADAQKIFEVPETFSAIAGAVRENLDHIEKVIWQKYAAQGLTDIRLSETDFLITGDSGATPGISITSEPAESAAGSHLNALAASGAACCPGADAGACTGACSCVGASPETGAMSYRG